jgi:hypothetical protein
MRCVFLHWAMSLALVLVEQDSKLENLIYACRTFQTAGHNSGGALFSPQISAIYACID